MIEVTLQGTPLEVDDLDAEWLLEAVGGEGTPLVAAFTAEPFAAALGVSTASALT